MMKKKAINYKLLLKHSVWDPLYTLLTYTHTQTLI